MAVTLLLIGAYWERGGALPNDDAALARICRTQKDKLARWGFPVLAKFYCHEGLLYHPRVEFELLRSCDRIAKGTASANARWDARRMLPTSTPTKEESKKTFISKFVVGKKNGLGNGGSVTILDPSERLARFQKWLAEAIPGGHGWQIVASAADATHPEHLASLAFCKAEARRLGKGWPKQWPNGKAHL